MLKMNTVTLAGYVGGLPKVQQFENASKLTFRLATTDTWKDTRTQQLKERTDWHEIVFWGRSADQLARFIKKGSGLVIRGKLRCDEYENEHRVKQWRNYVQALEINLADKAEEKPQDRQAPSPGIRRPPPQRHPAQRDVDNHGGHWEADGGDDIPF